MANATQGIESPSIFATTVSLPNALSFLRLLIGLLFFGLPVSWQVPAFIMGAITDLLDGGLSRYFRLGCHLGRMLDPLADKVFVIGVAITLLWQGQLSWLELPLIGIRDIVVTVGMLTGLAYRHWTAFQSMTPTWLGKATTAAQFAFFLVLFLLPEYRSAALLITAGLSLAAGVDYLWKFFADWWPNRKVSRHS